MYMYFLYFLLVSKTTTRYSSQHLGANLFLTCCLARTHHKEVSMAKTSSFSIHSLHFSTFNLPSLIHSAFPVSLIHSAFPVSLIHSAFPLSLSFSTFSLDGSLSRSLLFHLFSSGHPYWSLPPYTPHSHHSSWSSQNTKPNGSQVLEKLTGAFHILHQFEGPGKVQWY